MAIEIGELRAILSLRDEFSKPIEDASKELGLMGTAFGVVTGLAAAAVGAIAATTGAIIVLGKRGAEVSDVQDAFRDLSARAGESADVMLGKLQQGTLGTISNFELMKLANTALSSGMVKTSDDMGTLAAGAQLLADRTGGDAATALATLTEAMAKGTSRQAELKFMFQGTDVAVKNYADSLHKNVGDLTDHQTAVIKSRIAMMNLKAELAAVGPANADFGEQIGRAKAALVNMTDSVAVAVASSPGLVAAVGAIADGLQFMAKWVQTNQQEIRVLISDGLVKLSGAFSTALVALGAVNEGFRIARTTLIDLYGPLTKAAFGFEFLQAVMAHPFEAADAWEDLKNKVAATDIVVAKMTNSANNQAATFAGLIQKVGVANENFAIMAAKTGEVTTKTHGATGAVGELGFAVEKTWSSQVNDAFEMMGPLFQETQDKALALAAKFTEVQDQIDLANHTGLAQRLFEIQQQSTAALLDAQNFANGDIEIYTALATKIRELYGQMTTAAVESFARQADAATHAGDTAVDVAQRVRDNAFQNETDVLANAESTDAEITAAHQQYLDAQEKLDDAKTKSAIDKFDLIANAAKSLLTSIFGKSKAAAIASVIIDVAQGVIKSFAQYGWPWGLIPAAAIVAAGVVQISKIRSTDPGFAEGTPGTAFQDFGRGTATTLHRHEAIVTPAQGESLAGMVGDAIREAMGGKGSEGGGQRPIIHVQIGPREIREFLVRELRGGFLPSGA